MDDLEESEDDIRVQTKENEMQKGLRHYIFNSKQIPY
jgi:hypothetical protein